MNEKHSYTTRHVSGKVACAAAVFGLMTVAHAQTISAWKNAADGNWGVAGNWSDEGVPNANMAHVTNVLASYTVTYDSVQPSFKDLIIENAGAHTTDLLISAPLVSKGGAALRLRHGSRVTVNPGGDWTFDGAANSVTTDGEGMLSILGGGVLKIAGGAVAFTNLPNAAGFGNKLVVGYQSEGALTVTGGTFAYYETFPRAVTNNYRSLRVGWGTNGDGSLNISGGAMLLGKGDAYDRLMDVGYGSGGGSGTRGKAVVSGGLLQFTNNLNWGLLTIGANGGHGAFVVTNTGVVNLSSKPYNVNARVYVGVAGFGNGLLRVDGGYMNVGDGVTAGSKGAWGWATGTVEVTAGTLETGAGLVLGAGETTSEGGDVWGEANISGGRVSESYWGVFVARSRNGGRAFARMTITNGLLDIISSALPAATGGVADSGCYAGLAVGANYVNDTHASASALGELILSGSGIITNAGVFVVGVNGGTGTVTQTGGALVHAPAGDASQQARKMTVLGYGFGTGAFGGGHGTYELSGGTFSTPSRVFVGGVPTNVLSYARAGCSGLLYINGGSFSVTNNTLMVGGNGAGKLTVGASGVCFAKDIVLTNNTQATLRFELGSAGVGMLKAGGNLAISSGAKLEVDASKYVGRPEWLKLAACATRTGSFDPADITVVGSGVVRQDRDENIWFCVRPGALLPSREMAAFFSLIDFDNASLLTKYPKFQAVRTQVTNAAALPSEAAALSMYEAAMSNLWSSLSARNYTCGPSHVVQNSAAFASNFCASLNLDHPGLEAVKAHVLAADYPAALEAWRDYRVDAFRSMFSPPIYQQSYKSHIRQQNIVSLLLGEKSYSQYLADGTNAYGGIDFYEIYGMSGAPGTISPISWTNQPPTADTTLDGQYSYYQFFFASSLLYRYWSGTVLASGANLSLTSSDTLVTASLSAPHGLTNGSYVCVAAASPAAYNGLFRVSVVSPTVFTYTALSAPGSSPASGTGRSAACTRQAEPLLKWFEILADFSTRQKSMVAALQLYENPSRQAAYRTIYGSSDWSGQAAAALGQGDRVNELLGALSLFCKMLPEATPVQREWNASMQEPLTQAPVAGAMQQIPAEAMARVTQSLMADNTEALMLTYFLPGWFPNQRLNGLRALYLVATFLDEFKAAPELLRQVDVALTDFAHTSFYPDGAMLERSPNYNAGDAGKIRLMVRLEGTNGIAGVALLADRLAACERVFAFMQTPYGGLPRMASDAGYNPTELWLGGATLDAWRTRFRNWVSSARDTTATNLYLGMLDSGQPVPSATSVAFPYAGYYLMRNGWSSRSHYLYFANTPPGNGHSQMDMNGIQVSAFGRSLLSTAGPPPYGPTFVDASQTNDYAGFALYQGEGSSFKVNTVAVDGRSQNENRVRNATATTTTMTNTWFTGPEFDYVEGSYSAGYGNGNGGWMVIYDAFTNSTALVTSVTHVRSVFFLRDPGLWVVTDVMASRDSSRHDYRQIWNFPAYSAVTGPMYGFATNEVIADSAAHQIRTVDADGPNIHLYHLGPQPVTYETYVASRTPYLGWSGNGINGLRLPAANVHACWQGVGTQLLVTVLAPSDTGTASPVISILTNSSSAAAIDMELGLANGHTLRIVQGSQPQALTLGGQSLFARTVIADTAPDGMQRGLTLGAAGLTATNFSFDATATNFTPLVAIGRPANAVWQTDGDWLQLSTSDLQNTPPTISVLPEQYVAQDTLSWLIPFTVSDRETQAANLSVSVYALDAALLPAEGMMLAGSGANRTLVVTPAANQVGATTVVLTVTDPQGATQESRFSLTVYPTRYTLPYRESFERFEPDFLLPGFEAWFGEYHAARVAAPAAVLDRLHAYGQPVGYPLRDEEHAKVAVVEGAVSNRLASSSGTAVWCDLMVDLVREQELSPVMPPEMQCALFLDDTGRLNVWHRDLISGTNRWSGLAWQTAQTSQWARVTLQLDYATWDALHDARYFRLFVDGAGQSHALAYTANDGTGSPGGPWFALATPADRINALLFGGCGVVDDVTVDTARPLIGLGPHGTPEWWLADNSLTNGLGLALNELADDDRDGFLNWKEYAAGTSPTNDASLLRFIDLPGAANNRLALVIQTVPGRRYTLEGSATLEPDSWEAVAFALTSEGASAQQTITATAETLTFYVEADGPLHFFRVQVIP